MTCEEIHESAWWLTLPTWALLALVIPLPAAAFFAGVVAWLARMWWVARRRRL